MCSGHRLHDKARRLADGRRDASLQDDHRFAAAAAHQLGALRRLRGCCRRPEHQQAQQLDEALAVRVQEAVVACASKSLGQHVLHHQPQEGGATDRADHGLAGAAVTPAVGDGGAVAAEDVVLLDDATVKVATEIDQGLASVTDTLAVHHPFHRNLRRDKALLVQGRQEFATKHLGQRLVVEQVLGLAGQGSPQAPVPIECGAGDDQLAQYGTPEIVNTDQGSQFTAEEFTSVVLGAGSKLSMDGRGAWRDNVFVERLWRSVKYERVYLKAYDSVSAARGDISDYLALCTTRSAVIPGWIASPLTKRTSPACRR
jgi:hypothetical protein